MILRVKPQEPQILTKPGLGCFFCGKIVEIGIAQKPMSGSSWGHIECHERAEKAKADKKLSRKASMGESISKMSQKQQDYYLKPTDHTVKGLRGEEIEDLF